MEDGKKVIDKHVTPFVGVWIEIDCIQHIQHSVVVTPFVGVWIEIIINLYVALALGVTPFVGVWIEIRNVIDPVQNAWSLPSWECGLKYA